MNLSSQIVGNVGLYYACYKLSMLGWNVMPTARNARGVDIIAYSSDAKRFVAIQVKTLSKRSPVPLGPTLDKCMGDFWIVLNNVGSGAPSAFVLKPEEVIKNSHRGEKQGRVSFWLQPKAYEQSAFLEAWERIGHGGLDSSSAGADVKEIASPSNIIEFGRAQLKKHEDEHSKL